MAPDFEMELTDGQKVKLSDSLVIRLGLEPKTPTLKVLCSTC